MKDEYKKLVQSYVDKMFEYPKAQRLIILGMGEAYRLGLKRAQEIAEEIIISSIYEKNKVDIKTLKDALVYVRAYTINLSGEKPKRVVRELEEVINNLKKERL